MALSVLKEVIGKTRKSQSCHPRKLVINKVEITDQEVIENLLNVFFKNIGSQLASNIPHRLRSFKTLAKTIDKTM